MRLRVSVDLPKRVEQCFAVGAAIAVVMSDGGEWLDHGTPVDAPALRQYLDGIGAQMAVDLSQDEPEPVTVHTGRIDWRDHEIEMRAEQAQVNVAGVLVMSRAGFVAIKTNGRQPLWRPRLSLYDPPRYRVAI